MICLYIIALGAHIWLPRQAALTRVVTVESQRHAPWNLVNHRHSIIEVGGQDPACCHKGLNDVDLHVGDCQLHLGVAVLLTGHDLINKNLIVSEDTLADDGLSKNAVDSLGQTRYVRRYLTTVIIYYDSGVLWVCLS